jgi:hypothetical protein
MYQALYFSTKERNLLELLLFVSYSTGSRCPGSALACFFISYLLFFGPEAGLVRQNKTFVCNEGLYTFWDFAIVTKIE